MLPIRSLRHSQVSRGNSLRAHPSCSLRSRESTPPWLSLHNHVRAKRIERKAKKMRSTKRVPWIILALVALATGIIALVQRQRATAGQVTTERVTTGKAAQSGYRQTPFWHIYDQIAETLDHKVGWDKVPTPL